MDSCTNRTRKTAADSPRTQAFPNHEQICASNVRDMRKQAFHQEFFVITFAHQRYEENANKHSKQTYKVNLRVFATWNRLFPRQVV